MNPRSLRIALTTFPTLVEAGSEICVPNASQISFSERSSLLSKLCQTLRSDEELAQQLQKGNSDALAPLFERHSRLVFAICRRILRNDSEAEDAAQQIFLDVFRSIHQWNPEKGTFKKWLLIFTYHRTFNHRRALLAARFFDSDPFEDHMPELSRTNRTQAVPEDRILVQQVLSGLELRQRRAIELTYFEGLTAEEISAQTGETVRVVRHNLYRGLERLRKTLGKRVHPATAVEVTR
jgi:RNA polymerase sigma-70 factor, ECF subfamily